MLSLNRLLLSLVAVVVLASFFTGSALSQSSHVDVVRLEGVINPVAAGYIERAIRQAEEDGAQALVIQMDTPGGLSSSMDDIIKSMVNSSVPVVVYVYPPGGRAASAGVFITYAAHVAAMAPSTNIGSASPVAIGEGGEQQMSETMERKVVNDAVAQIRGLAERHGRNADWAEQAVREAVNITAAEALELNVIDLIAENLPALLDEIDGRQVQTTAGTITLQTRDAEVKNIDRTFLEDFLGVISNPDIAVILLSLGMLAIFFELSNPGSIFPGVVGGIFLLLAFYALGTLPINYAGLLLIVFAFILFIADVFVPSFGVLTIGAVVSLALGLLLLFNTGAAPFYSVSLPIVITVVVLVTAFFVFAVGAVVRARLRRPFSGREGMIDEIAEVRTELNPRGMVFVEGELWNAVSEDGYIREGERVRVTGMDGLTLRVRRELPAGAMEVRTGEQPEAARHTEEVPQEKGL